MREDWITTDPLNAEVIGGALATRWLGRRIAIERELDSTNDRVRALALAGHPPGLVVLAEEQTRGRGRQGQPEAALCNCLGFGSKNSAIVLGRARP